jgi:hypothetical protein
MSIGYQDAPAVTHTFTTREPSPVQLRSDRLRD